jgi:hypothetical protein
MTKKAPGAEQVNDEMYKATTERLSNQSSASVERNREESVVHLIHVSLCYSIKLHDLSTLRTRVTYSVHNHFVSYVVNGGGVGGPAALTSD